MGPNKVKTPTDITVLKFIYRNKERLWLKVDKFENVDSKPMSQGITYNQYVKKHKTKVVETKQ